MDRRGAKPFQGEEMLAHRIALVPGKAVAWILRVQTLHKGVASGLGQDGRRGDRQALAVALDDRLLGYGHVLDAPRIDEQVLRTQRKPTSRYRELVPNWIGWPRPRSSVRSTDC